MRAGEQLRVGADQAGELGGGVGAEVGVDEPVDRQFAVGDVVDGGQLRIAVAARDAVPAFAERVVVDDDAFGGRHGGKEVAHVDQLAAHAAGGDAHRAHAGRFDERRAVEVDLAPGQRHRRALRAQRLGQREAALEVAEADGRGGIGADRDVHALTSSAAFTASAARRTL